MNSDQISSHSFSTLFFHEFSCSTPFIRVVVSFSPFPREPERLAKEERERDRQTERKRGIRGFPQRLLPVFLPAVSQVRESRGLFLDKGETKGRKEISMHLNTGSRYRGGSNLPASRCQAASDSDTMRVLAKNRPANRRSFARTLLAQLADAFDLFRVSNFGIRWFQNV